MECTGRWKAGGQKKGGGILPPRLSVAELSREVVSGVSGLMLTASAGGR